jgi:hypothetical protein
LTASFCGHLLHGRVQQLEWLLPYRLLRHAVAAAAAAWLLLLLGWMLRPA